MKALKNYLEKIRKIERKKHHPLLHKVHKKHNISRKTLFYIKEYGPQANVPKTIIRESLKVLVFASILSALGGLALENLKVIFVSIIPLVILMPALNDMIGDYGTIMSSRFSAMLHEGKANGNLWKNKSLGKLIVQIMIVAFLTTLLSTAIALTISGFKSAEIASKILFIALFDVLFFVSVLCAITIAAGLYFYKKGEDPNNFLIPITTAVADFGNMVVLAALIIFFF